MKTVIIAVTDSGIINNPSAETLAAWALAQHLEACPQCRRGEELCPAGERHDAATRADLSWIPEMEA